MSSTKGITKASGHNGIAWSTERDTLPEIEEDPRERVPLADDCV